jgi:hypothetical protein
MQSCCFNVSRFGTYGNWECPISTIET